MSRGVVTYAVGGARASNLGQEEDEIEEKCRMLRMLMVPTYFERFLHSDHPELFWEKMHPCIPSIEWFCSSQFFRFV